MCFSVFFCKQKTAYEMRISDWSSDVCSSDLVGSGDAGIENALGVAEEALENRVTILNRSRDFARAKAKNVSDLMDAGENGAIDIRTETQPRLVEDGWMTLETPNGDERIARSEEHTSELQSLMRISYAVFCLKKKKKTHKNR